MSHEVILYTLFYCLLEPTSELPPSEPRPPTKFHELSPHKIPGYPRSNIGFRKEMQTMLERAINDTRKEESHAGEENNGNT